MYFCTFDVPRTVSFGVLQIKHNQTAQSKSVDMSKLKVLQDIVFHDLKISNYILL